MNIWTVVYSDFSVLGTVYQILYGYRDRDNKMKAEKGKFNVYMSNNLNLVQGILVAKI